MTDIMQVSVY